MTNTTPPASARIPDGSVVITPTQMYTEIQNANQKIDHLTSILDPAIQDIRDDVADHETRLRRIERLVWQASGAAVVVGGAVSAAISYFGH